MSLLVYNTGSVPVTLSGVVPPVIVPTSTTASLVFFNVTSYLQSFGLGSALYVGLEAQRQSYGGALGYVWDGVVNFDSRPLSASYGVPDAIKNYITVGIGSAGASGSTGPSVMTILPSGTLSVPTSNVWNELSVGGVSTVSVMLPTAPVVGQIVTILNSGTLGQVTVVDAGLSGSIVSTLSSNGTKVDSIRNPGQAKTYVYLGSGSWFVVIDANSLAPLISSFGLVAEWRFNEGGGQIVYNNVYPHQPVVNLAGPLDGYAAALGATSNYAFSPNNDFTALRVQIGAGSFVDVTNFPYANNTTYVVSVYAKSNTGGTQKFRFATDTGVSYSVDQIVTTSWQRFYFSFTSGNPAQGFLLFHSDVAGEAADLQFWGLQLELGTVPTTFAQPSFQATLGLHGAVDASDPTWNSSGLHFVAASSQYARAMADQPFSGQQASVYVVAQRVGSPNNGNYQPLVGTKGFTTDLQLDMGTIVADWPGFNFSNQSEARANATSNDGLWHLIAGTCDGFTMRIYMDDVELGSTSLPGGAGLEIIYQLLIGNLNNAAYFAGNIAYGSVYNVGHSPTQYFANRGAIQQIMAPRNISIPDLDSFVVFEGDSITAPTSTGYPTLNMQSVIKQGRNFATSGAVTSDWVSRAAQIDSFFKSWRRHNILSVMGANDLINGFTPAQYVSNLKTYCQARRAVGWKVLLMTVLPRTTGGFNANRNTANALIVADPSFYDYLVRLDLDTTIGLDASASNATYYPDGVHPSAAAHLIIAADQLPILSGALV